MHARALYGFIFDDESFSVIRIVVLFVVAVLNDNDDIPAWSKTECKILFHTSINEAKSNLFNN